MNSETKLTVSAATIGEKFVLDPDLQLPVYPRYIKEILMFPNDQSSVLFVGGSGMQVLAGRSARRFIPELIKHLDGKKSLADLAALYPQHPPKVIRDAITLLFSRGLLEDGDSPDIKTELTPLAQFSGRYIDATRNNKNRGEVVSRLADSHVTIAISDSAGSLHAETLMSAFANMGLKNVECINEPESLSKDTDLLIAFFIGEDESASQWMLRANKMNKKVLHASIGREDVEVGPLFVPGQSGCYDCFRHIRQASEKGERSDIDFWLGVVALNAYHLLTRVGQFELYNVCRIHSKHDSGDFYSQTRVSRLPGCKTCGLGHTRLKQDSPQIKPWILHNAAVIISSYEFRNPKEHQSHYAAANISISEAAPKPIIGAQIVSLPSGLDFDALPGWKQAPGEARNINLEELAILLRYSVGYQPTTTGMRRIAPSGGGLGSSELYLSVRDIAGLDNGIYHYFGYSHVLERLGDMPDQLLCGALGVAKSQLPQAAIIGITNMNKARQKYDRFAFRLGTVDSGVTQTYLTELMNAMSIRYTEYLDIRSKVLAHAINLSVAGNANYVSFAFGVGLAADSLRERRLDFHHTFYVDNLIDEVDMLGTHTQMFEGTMPVQPDPLTEVTVPPLRDMMLNRRSIRNFADRAVPLNVLNAIASLAIGINPLRVAHGALDVDIKLWAAVNKGDEQYEPGIYLAEEGQLQLQRAGCYPAQLEPMMLQRSLALAPVVFFITGNVETALISSNAKGYHELVRRAGAILSKLFLVAQGYQVQGCIFGGIYEETWGDVLGVDRYTDCPLLAGSLGYYPDE
jgi:SagB-type dehydrogenase family enzyme